MARPGQIDGKTKSTLYLDEEVHRALRIRAAETGESMGDIAERALRKELGLMTMAERIAQTFETGTRWELEDGTRLEDVLEAEADRQETQGTLTLYRFADGSAIVTAEEGWWDTLEGARKAGLEI